LKRPAAVAAGRLFRIEEYCPMNHRQLAPAALAQLFTEARTHGRWQDRPVSDSTLRALYDLAKWAPTSMNCNPLRLVFITSPAAKQRLRPALAAGNLDKVMSAPVTAIVAGDPRFYEQLPSLFPANPGARAAFAGDRPWAEQTAFRNSTLQGGYLILAARALGLDCGPMSGFDNAKVDAEFFSASGYRSNFLLNLGYGSGDRLYPRGPRPAFTEVAAIL
jgi:3-hydroxypropanoate dehydrogenase